MLVRGVDGFVAEDAAWGDHAQGRPEFLHAAYLHRRGVGAEQVAAIEPEGILHVARGVVGRDVERVEVVEFRFDFGTIEHGETHGAEEILDLPLDLRDGVEAAGRDADGGDSEIHPFGIETFGESFAVEGGFLCRRMPIRGTAWWR